MPGVKMNSGSIETRQRPTRAETIGSRGDGGLASGVIASRGLTRDADHAGNNPAASAAASDPKTPSAAPGQSTITPAVKKSAFHLARTNDQKSPSGTPTTAPANPSIAPSITTSA